MNSIARVKNAILHKPGTPIARGELMLDFKFARNFLNWRKRDTAAHSISDTELLRACCRALRLDLVCLQSAEIPDSEARLSVKLTDIARFSDDGLFVFWVVNGSFQTALTRRGAMAFFKAVAESPDAVCKELRHLSKRVIAEMVRGVKAGVHGIIIADDIAYRQNTYISPDFVKQHLLPIWQTQVTTARDLGVPAFFHSDGNLNAVLPTIAAAGFDGLQCIEPAAGMDMPAVKAEYGHTLCLMGNVDPALLSDQSIQGGVETRCEHLRRAVLDLMASAGGDGGFIFGTCSGLQAGMSPELVQYMYDLATDPDTTVPAKFP